MSVQIGIRILTESILSQFYIHGLLIHSCAFTICAPGCLLVRNLNAYNIQLNLFTLIIHNLRAYRRIDRLACWLCRSSVLRFFRHGWAEYKSFINPKYNSYISPIVTGVHEYNLLYNIAILINNINCYMRFL